MQVHAYCGDMTVEVMASPESESLGKSEIAANGVSQVMCWHAGRQL